MFSDEGTVHCFSTGEILCTLSNVQGLYSLQLAVNNYY